MTAFSERALRLPVLGIGVSTEYGAGASPSSLDPLQLRRDHPRWGGFLEVGVETAKGLDAQARAWAAAGLPTTYHFLDLNLDEPEDLDPRWLDELREIAAVLRPAWLCGDAGLWHVGPRDRAHMLLLPPILTDGSASALADGVRALREATGLEVLPENPPGVAFVGDLHILDFFARVAERADTGLLLDVAHLAIAQRLTGHAPLDGLDGFPADRVIEVHVAGGAVRDHQGFAWIDDDHGTAVLDDTWAILEHLLPRAPNLRAVVFECERNAASAVAPGFARIEALLQAGRRGECRSYPLSPGGGEGRGKGAASSGTARAAQALQRVVVRMLHDPPFARAVARGPIAELDEEQRALLLAVDPRAWETDPLRRTRLLQALIEEFPVGSALASRGGRDLGALDRFVSSPGFHRAIQERRVLALAFGEWLVARVGEIACIELACAGARRPGPPPAVPMDLDRAPALVRAPGIVPLTLPAGTLDRWAEVRRRLGADPLGSLAAGVDLVGLPVPGSGREHWLVERDEAGSPALGASSPELGGLLEAAAEPRPEAELSAVAIALGAAPDEAPALLERLRADGLLVLVEGRA